MKNQIKTSIADSSASVVIDGDQVVIDWANGHKQKFESIFLRHSAGFPGGARPAGTNGRFPKPPVGFRPHAGEITGDGDLRLTWKPGNVISVHESKWLQQNCSVNPRSHDASLLKPILWDRIRIEKLTHHDYSKLKNSDLARLEVFDQMIDWGVAMITGVPDSEDAVQEIASWFGQTLPNSYADNPGEPALSSIRVDPDTPVATNMCHFLGPHTDTCWRQTLIGLLLMHCLKAHPEGGRSLLVDGFMVASRLREISKEAFDLLSSVPVNFGSKVKEQDDWRVLGRIISVAADNATEGIRYNGNSIDQLEVPEELIAPMYKALELFESVLYDKSLWWQPLLQPGEALIIDNHRILHGREAFNPEKGERHLRTCGISRDDFHNCYRRFAKRMGSKRWNQRFSAGVI